MSLGQRGDYLERGIAYASQRQWIESGSDNRILLTNLGSEKGNLSR
jgi:hypothetical protein